MITADTLVISGSILIVGIAIFWMWITSEKRRRGQQ